jgi:hypothetical protein
MSHGGYHGVVKMGGKTIQQGSSSDGQGGQTGGGVYNPQGYDSDYDTGKPGDASDLIAQGISPTTDMVSKQDDKPVVEKEEITGLPSGGILQALYGGGAGSIEGYDPENTQYNLEGQHPLSQQFVRLADKYYGGDQEAFAQSSQGQVLLNYLQDVPYTKGGLLGLPTQELEEKLAGLDLDILSNEALKGDDSDPFKTPIGSDITKLRFQPNFSRSTDVDKRLGALTSDEYKKFNEFLFATRPDLYTQARPFSSGKIPAIAAQFLINPTSTFTKGIANSFLKAAGKDPLKENEPFKGIATDNQFLTDGQALNPNLSSLIQPLDQGGMNDVAQAVIDQNETPGMKTDNEDNSGILAQLILDQLPEGGINTFDPNSFAFSIG